MNPIYAAGDRVVLALNRMLATKLAAGEPVTHEFDLFCARKSLSLVDGIDHPDRPYPFARPTFLACVAGDDEPGGDERERPAGHSGRDVNSPCETDAERNGGCVTAPAMRAVTWGGH